MNEWATAVHAEGYLDRGEDFPPHRREGEGVLLDCFTRQPRRVLDLGTGDGRLMALIDAPGVALDVSPTMLAAARARFAGRPDVAVLEHDLDDPLPELGSFDVVVSSFAIHHCTHERKRALYGEIFDLLEPGGVFCNLEHVASATPELHLRFFEVLGFNPDDEDPSNKLLEVETQLGWLREIGFDQVDCHWKWRELALMSGVKPGV
jgi:SAM-dependent methyltransferase